uniref:Uncharacterized protein n=1 Tax=Romanomermis culicivorax TaxID=13658 RepID=A0A915JZ34_ROMCU
MTCETSPIIDYYPTTVQTDLNGKKQDWEAVVLIPFIDEMRLLDAMNQYDLLLTEDEKRRNTFGETLLFVGEKFAPKTQTSSFPSSLPGVFPDITHDIAECFKLNRTCFHMDRNLIKKGLLPNVKVDVFFPGFPTFKHIPITHELKSIDVKVFQANSRNPSQVLRLDRRSEFADLLQGEPEKLADRLVGRELYVNWPYLTLGLCGSFVTRDNVYTKDFDKRLKIRKADLEHFERHEQNIRL